ncbi:hypothetical protein F7725_023222, partial [Dissostichus mawsoni]
GSGRRGNSNDGEEFVVYSALREDKPARILIKMSEFDSNPFADPAGDNPFNDPSVTQVTSVNVEPVDQFNPFPAHPTDNLATHTTSPYQPAATAAAAQANLLRQQEELERKAAELDRREQELQSRGPTGKQNNWPPLPKSFPIKAFNCVTLFLNLLACLAYFTTSASYGVDFGLSILWLILFAPCSFLCWTDSSFSFFFFFFVFFCQVVVFIIQTVGIPHWGNSTNKAVGAIMIIVAILFTICAVLSVILLKMVHSMYRRTGASFTKAQHEFSQGVLTNKTFQTALPERPAPRHREPSRGTEAELSCMPQVKVSMLSSPDHSLDQSRMFRKLRFTENFLEVIGGGRFLSHFITYRP